jgi:iron complex outermembrane recepter protein
MDRDRRGVSRMRALALTCCLLGVPGLGLAEDPDAKRDRLKMEPLVVEAPALEPDRTAGEAAARRELRRIPGGVGLVPEDAYRESRAFNLKDALDFVPGVLVRPRFGSDEAQLSVRGSGLRNNYHLRGVNVLIDGFPFGNADGFSDPESFELLATKRVEVYKGANALRFGAGSLGGAVNFVSRTGHDVAPLEITSEGGSFGYRKHSFTTGTAADGWDLLALYTDTELDGYRDHSQQTRRRGIATLGRTFAEGGSLRLDLGFVDTESRLPGALTEAGLDDDPESADPSSVAADARHDYAYGRAALSGSLPLGPRQWLETQAQVNVQDLFHPLAFAVLTGDTWSWGAETRYRRLDDWLGRPNRLTIGVQYAGTEQEDARFEAIGDARKGARTRDQRNESWTIAAYGESQLEIVDRLEVVAGGRFLHSNRSIDPRGDLPGNLPDDSTDFTAFTPKLGIVWRAAEAIDVYGNVSRSYEPPLLLELSSPREIGGSLDDLDAQRAWQFEVGTRGRIERIAWDVSVFDLEIRDEILNVNVAPFPGAPFTIPRFRNVDETRHTGVEAGADVELARGLARRGSRADALLWRVAYTWSRFVFVDDDEFGSNDLPGAPEHFLRSELRWDSGLGLWIAPGMEAVPEGYVVDSANEFETDAYALFGVRGGYRVAAWNLDLFVEGRNLLDETFVSSVQVDAGNLRFFEPGDGRAFYGGVRWTWS